MRHLQFAQNMMPATAQAKPVAMVDRRLSRCANHRKTVHSARNSGDLGEPGYMRRLVFSYVTNLAAYGPVRLIAAVGMIIVCSLTEGVSIAFLIPVLQAAGLDLENQAATESIAKAVTLGFSVCVAQPTLPLLLMIFISIVGARSLLSRAQSVAIFAVEQHFVLALRQRLHQAITNADWLFLCRSRSPDFTHGLTEEAPRLGGATFVLLTLAADLTVSAV